MVKFVYILRLAFISFNATAVEIHATHLALFPKFPKI